jgi:predicted small lipoprotein YifL
MRRLLLLLLVLAGPAGCGQKGPLFLPPEPPPAGSAPR